MLFLVGNKSDLTEKEQVLLKEGNDLALKKGIMHKTISASKNFGVEEVFQKLGEKLAMQPTNVRILTLPADDSSPHKQYETKPFSFQRQERGR